MLPREEVLRGYLLCFRFPYFDHTPTVVLHSHHDTRDFDPAWQTYSHKGALVWRHLPHLECPYQRRPLLFQGIYFGLRLGWRPVFRAGWGLLLNRRGKCHGDGSGVWAVAWSEVDGLNVGLGASGVARDRP